MKNSYVFIIYLVYLTILQSLNLIGPKYGQGHWKWYEQVKLKVKYYYAMFDICYIYGVWINPNVKVFNKPKHLTNTTETTKQKHNTHWSHTDHIMHNFLFLNMCTNNAMFKLHMTSTKNMQFAVYISDTHVTFKQGQGHQT